MSVSLLYAGSYGSGIHCLRQDPATGDLTREHAPVEITDPSFLAWHPSKAHMYAVCESPGSVAALAAGPDGALTVLNSQPTGGTSPCHLAVDPSGRFVVAANYGDGTVSVHPIDADGGVEPCTDLVRHKGSGPRQDRQEGPHAHMVTFTRYPQLCLVTDLGTDQVMTYRLEPPGRLSLVHAAGLTPGSGPRHIASHPDGSIYVNGELDWSVEVCELGADALVRPVARHSAMVGTTDAVNYPSHIECSADGRFVYSANRGADCVSVFAARPWQPIADVPTAGKWPRHFALVGDFLYAANQHSDSITVSRVDAATGVPGPFRVAAEVPGASCVLAA